MFKFRKIWRESLSKVSSGSMPLSAEKSKKCQLNLSGQKSWPWSYFQFTLINVSDSCHIDLIYRFFHLPSYTVPLILKVTLMVPVDWYSNCNTTSVKQDRLSRYLHAKHEHALNDYTKMWNLLDDGKIRRTVTLILV